MESSSPQSTCRYMMLVLKTEFQDKLYYYKGIVWRIIDGDTMDVLIDQGLHIEGRRERLRLARIDAPEKRGAEKEAGYAAMVLVKLKCPPGSTVYLQTIKDKSGGFGRFLAEVFFEDPNESGVLTNLNDLLVRLGHAEYKDY